MFRSSCHQSVPQGLGSSPETCALPNHFPVCPRLVFWGPMTYPIRHLSRDTPPGTWIMGALAQKPEFLLVTLSWEWNHYWTFLIVMGSNLPRHKVGLSGARCLILVNHAACQQGLNLLCNFVFTCCISFSCSWFWYIAVCQETSVRCLLLHPVNFAGCVWCEPL